MAKLGITLTTVILYSVSQKNYPQGFLAVFPRQLRIFKQNFTSLLLCVNI